MVRYIALLALALVVLLGLTQPVRTVHHTQPAHGLSASIGGVVATVAALAVAADAVESTTDALDNEDDD